MHSCSSHCKWNYCYTYFHSTFRLHSTSFYILYSIWKFAQTCMSYVRRKRINSLSSCSLTAQEQFYKAVCLRRRVLLSTHTFTLWPRQLKAPSIAQGDKLWVPCKELWIHVIYMRVLSAFIYIQKGASHQRSSWKCHISCFASHGEVALSQGK